MISTAATRMTLPFPERAEAGSLAAACGLWVRRRIQSRIFPGGARLPSIRGLAASLSVSPFTVADAYEQLVAEGLIESRRGSGFYVRAVLRADRRVEPGGAIDLAWLMRHMLDSGVARGPGVGVLPATWLDGAPIGDAVRALGREGVDRWVTSGSSHGFAPLREVLSRRLDGLGVTAGPDQIILTTGITQALDLVVRTLLAPRDPVLVLDPAWFGAIAVLSAAGARVAAVPSTPAGPDLRLLDRLMGELSPRLLVLSATAQNPTGLTLSASAREEILALAERHDTMIFEDDVYSDFAAAGAERLAARERLDRVIYAGSFSKTLSPNLRAGFVAARPDLAERLAATKVLTGFTTPEMNERLLHRLLIAHRYARLASSLAGRLDEARAAALDMFRTEGMPVFGRPDSGLFLWIDTGCDTTLLAAAAHDQGLLVVPGALFSPTQARSTWTRFNLATPAEERDSFLALVREGRRRPGPGQAPARS
jgi:DNA-binding transcriptional MocR family regulator